MSAEDKALAAELGELAKRLPEDAREHLLAYGEGMAALASLRAAKEDKPKEET